MIVYKRKLLTLTLAVVGARQRARKLQAKQQDVEEIQKWEGEGGSPSPASVSSPVLATDSPTSSHRHEGILPWPGKIASTFECPLSRR